MCASVLHGNAPAACVCLLLGLRHVDSSGAVWADDSAGRPGTGHVLTIHQTLWSWPLPHQVHVHTHTHTTPDMEPHLNLWRDPTWPGCFWPTDCNSSSSVCVCVVCQWVGSVVSQSTPWQPTTTTAHYAVTVVVVVVVVVVVSVCVQFVSEWVLSWVSLLLDNRLQQRRTTLWL